MKNGPIFHHAFAIDLLHLKQIKIDSSKIRLFSFIKICIDSYISFERFVPYRFSKLLSTNILLFRRCMYVSPQKLTSLVYNMTLQKELQ
jgi:hypothetical protein